MHAHFPLERSARHASRRFQGGFARRAMELLQTSDLFQFEASGTELLLRGQNETALARPSALLRDIFGPDLCLSPLQVRYLNLGGRLHEPIMLLRVRTQPRYLAAVRADLDARGVKLLEQYERANVCVLRGEAPLRQLLGYGEALDEMTDGSAFHWTWLERYSPVGPPPGGQAA